MDNYVTGGVIKALREKKKMTQEELAQKIFVTGKAVSKWETGRGFPDIGLLESLGQALGVSVIELLTRKDQPRPALKLQGCASFMPAASSTDFLQWTERTCLKAYL